MKDMIGRLPGLTGRMMSFAEGLARAQRESLQRKQDMERTKARDRLLPRCRRVNDDSVTF